MRLTWPADTGVLVDSLLAGGGVLAGIRLTLQDVLLTQLAKEASALAVTLKPANQRNHSSQVR